MTETEKEILFLTASIVSNMLEKENKINRKVFNCVWSLDDHKELKTLVNDLRIKRGAEKTEREANEVVELYKNTPVQELISVKLNKHRKQHEEDQELQRHVSNLIEVYEKASDEGKTGLVNELFDLVGRLCHNFEIELDEESD